MSAGTLVAGCIQAGVLRQIWGVGGDVATLLVDGALQQDIQQCQPEGLTRKCNSELGSALQCRLAGAELCLRPSCSGQAGLIGDQ